MIDASRVADLDTLAAALSAISPDFVPKDEKGHHDHDHDDGDESDNSSESSSSSSGDFKAELLLPAKASGSKLFDKQALQSAMTSQKAQHSAQNKWKKVG